MSALLPVKHRDDILPAYRNTPAADLLAYQNLRRPHRSHDRAELLIGMCMDHRMVLRIPDHFAYILRAGGGEPPAHRVLRSPMRWPSAGCARSALSATTSAAWLT